MKNEIVSSQQSCEEKNLISPLINLGKYVPMVNARACVSIFFRFLTLPWIFVSVDFTTGITIFLFRNCFLSNFYKKLTRKVALVAFYRLSPFYTNFYND